MPTETGSTGAPASSARGPATGRALVVLALCSTAAELTGCAPPREHGRPPASDVARQAAELELRANLRTLPDPADVRPEARAMLEQLGTGASYLAVPPPPSFGIYGLTLPATIRVWRRSKGGATSCAGPVDVLPLEDYVKGVLPHEWIVSWGMESLRAGSIAIRSYASAWIAKGGKYDCADVCDTTYTQVYKDATNPKTNTAVDDTKGQIVAKNGAVVFAEYSAENGDPTAFGVSDPPCNGKTVNGHGRGMCQWGSQRWSQQGKAYQWIAEHYYPGSALLDTTTPIVPDAGTVPDLPPALPDAAPADVWGGPEAAPPPPDSAVFDHGGTTIPDAAPRPPGSLHARHLQGGCATTPLDPALPLPSLLLLLWAAARLLRRT